MREIRGSSVKIRPKHGPGEQHEGLLSNIIKFVQMRNFMPAIAMRQKEFENIRGIFRQIYIPCELYIW